MRNSDSASIAVDVRQSEVEQDQIEIRIVTGRFDRLGKILGFDQVEFGVEDGQHVPQRFANQRVVVDYQNFHGPRSRLSVLH